MMEQTYELSQVDGLDDDLALVVTTDLSRDPVPLEGKSLTIGRGPGNDIVLRDGFVSASHCRIEERRGLYRVHDLGSRNGTVLNGARIREGTLALGAQLFLGRALLLCLKQGPRQGSFLCPGGLVGRSGVMRQVAAEIALFAPTPSPVLIEGETGTGKELAARAVHEMSHRRRGPFVAVNCGALSPELAMSELFGHERGSFTGAESLHQGAFEQAEGGTLFLDEVGELDGRLQAALLRAVESQTFRRVGGAKERAVDVRVVAATNRDLESAVAVGSYRLDLFHRLAVLRLQMPPLRERREDLPDLAAALLVRARVPKMLSDDALAILAEHNWPGNVRELKNVLERACALSQGGALTASEIRIEWEAEPGCFGELGTILAVVAEHGGSVAAAARAMGMPRTTLRDKLQRAQEARRKHPPRPYRKG